MSTTPTGPAAPPDELIELKAEWYAADAAVRCLAAIEPEGAPIEGLKGTPLARREPSEAQRAALDDARLALQYLTRKIFQDPWKTAHTGQDRITAEAALNAAAAARFEADPGPFGDRLTERLAEARREIRI